MKRYLSLIMLFVAADLVIGQNAESKGSDKNRYTSVSGEMNFSGARIVSESASDGSKEEGGNIMRFAPWFNVQVLNNWDGRSSGFFAGFTIRNVGFIYGKDQERWKARTYNLGIPVGLKWGDMNGTFLYLGYEIEVPIHYKEKYFQNERKKDKFGVWFSDRVSPFTHAGFVGINFKDGFNIKAKYYFTQFFNPDFDNSGITNPEDIRYPGNGLAVNDPNYIAPRDYLTVNVVYLALTWNMFRKPYHYYDGNKVEKADQMY
ncbi:MAG: hypothetical protein RIE58_00885 [Vicingaceae bacterium]